MVESDLRLSRLPKNRRTYEANGGASLTTRALRWAEGIRVFLELVSEADTFARFFRSQSKLIPRK